MKVLLFGATGMVAHQNDLDAVANNLANVNTVGFRRGVVSFSEVSSQLTPSALDPALLLQALHQRRHGRLGNALELA